MFPHNVNGSPAVADSSFVTVATAYVDIQVLNIHANVWSGGVTGMASEDADGYGGNWSFTTIVTCADT
jgi:hypothetical protein